ncbi:MAG: T9SS type A sorting domain-containing protein [Fibrobacteres bacterium]|nr:T9SS type A sorting domain-containing protein [Fibrobacterota bacterium]
MRLKLLALSICFSVSGIVAGPIEDLKPREWYEVPNSKMRSVDPCPKRPCAWSGIIGQTGVIDAWCGGAFDTKRDRLIVWGGGHADYAGNELYTFDLNTLTWTRETNPGTPRIDSAYTLEGTPSSRHTYNFLQYLPSIDRFTSFSVGSLWGSGFAVPCSCVDAFDFDTKKWERLASSNALGFMSAYDALTGNAWTGRSQFGMYEARLNKWSKMTEYDNIVAWSYYATTEIDPKRRLMLAVGVSNGQTYKWDISNLNIKITASKMQTTGDTGIQSAKSPGLAYDPVTEQMVAWNGGSSVYTLNPDTKIWIKHTATNNVVPTAATSAGTYGRFRYSPKKNVFVVVSGVDQNVFIYRHTASESAPQWYLDLLEPETKAETRKDVKHIASLNVYPNPVYNKALIVLKGAAAGMARLNVVDANGRKISHMNVQTGSGSFFLDWSTTSLANGVYIITAETGYGKISQRFYISR